MCNQLRPAGLPHLDAPPVCWDKCLHCAREQRACKFLFLCLCALQSAGRELSKDGCEVSLCDNPATLASMAYC